MRSHSIGNPSGSNARMGLVIRMGGKPAIESQHNSRSTSSNALSHKLVKRMRSHCIGNPSGSNAGIGLVIAWEVFQAMCKQILKGKPRLNLNIIQEAQVRTCSRTSESNGFIRVVLGIEVDLMLEWDS
ncbi:uncharacterized protein G2W53_009891 [Senna tora]|uniref:Uncharacterized protein n=1 Tax=Senna tora TaxID=362788 RepID=A0A834WZQ6_9FABA|nr:uncharacterized protein G2W53_009891 [Senna tora]